MIRSVWQIVKGQDNMILMHGDIANVNGSLDPLAVLRAIRRRLLGLAPLCPSLFLTDSTKADIQVHDAEGCNKKL